jgi:D-ribose pyranose/furanose isomerase RbsD
MKRVTWEYLIHPAGSLDQERLNALGADGWELVTIHNGRGISKHAGHDAKATIRTGDTTPYSNLIVLSG